MGGVGATASFGPRRDGLRIKKKGVDAGETICDVACNLGVLPAQEIVWIRG